MIKDIVKAILFGLITLLVVNFIGQYINFNIPINIFTIILVGIFRLPGVIVILLFLIL